jgi:hypothetical protein
MALDLKGFGVELIAGRAASETTAVVAAGVVAAAVVDADELDDPAAGRAIDGALEVSAGSVTITAVSPVSCFFFSESRICSGREGGLYVIVQFRV